jgi:ATP adenylyltransferase
MERLYTPWRREFIEQAGTAAPSASPGCFLCEKPAEGDERDRESLILHRGRRAYVLMNLYPYNSGHLMVAPYAHVGDLTALAKTQMQELFALVQRTVAVLGDVYRPEGFNVGMNLGKVAGAGVPDHLHVHVVPRWGGDTNFMPIVGNTKVLPESLEQTYDRLRPGFAALSQPEGDP